MTKYNFGDVFDDVTKKGTKIPRMEYLTAGKYPVIDQGKDFIGGYTDSDEGIFSDVPAIIFGDHTRILKYVDTPFFIGADGVKILAPKMAGVNCKYLYYALQKVHVPNTGYNRHFKWLKQADIVVYDIDKQDEIVGQLDLLTSMMNKHQLLLDRYDELVKSRFIEMFGDIHKNPMGWRQSTVGEECYYIKDGPHKSPSYVTEETGVPFISTRNIVNGFGIDWSTAKYISEEDYQQCIKKCHPHKGDILYSKGGTTGIAKLVDTDRKFANWVHVAVLKFHDNLDGRFFESMLNTDYCYAQSQRLTKGVANRDFVLSAIAQVKIFIPPIELQRQYKSFVEQTNKSKLTIQKSMDNLMELRDSLLQEYFGQ